MFIACETRRHGAPAERNLLVLNGRMYMSLLRSDDVFRGWTYKHVAPPEQRQESQLCDYRFNGSLSFSPSFSLGLARSTTNLGNRFNGFRNCVKALGSVRSTIVHIFTAF